jgi:hypothetical protein
MKKKRNLFLTEEEVESLMAGLKAMGHEKNAPAVSTTKAVRHKKSHKVMPVPAFVFE